MSIQYAYMRVSSQSQSYERQLQELLKNEIDERHIFCEKESGAKTDRSELKKMLDVLKPGDSVTVVSLDRLGRNTRQLLEIAEYFSKNEIELISIKEAINTSSAAGRMFFTIASAFATFEREVIKERQSAGIKAAQAKGKRFGRKPMTDEKREAIIAAYNNREANGTTVVDIAKAFNVSRTTVYSIVADRTE